MGYLKKINDLLLEKKITKREFAKEIGKNENTIANYLTRKTKIDIETFIKIANVLGVSVGYFFDEEIITGDFDFFYSKFAEEEKTFLEIKKKIEENFEETITEQKKQGDEEEAYNKLFSDEKYIDKMMTEFELFDFCATKLYEIEEMELIKLGFKRFRRNNRSNYLK